MNPSPVQRPAARSARFLSLLALFFALAAAGCSAGYKITLTNGQTFVTPSKPKSDGQGNFIVKDAAGQTFPIHQMRIRSIEPASRKPSKSAF